jgi:hypothetical protein
MKSADVERHESGSSRSDVRGDRQRREEVMGNYTLRLTKDEFEILKLIPVPDQAIMANTLESKPLFSLMRKIYDAKEEDDGNH